MSILAASSTLVTVECDVCHEVETLPVTASQRAKWEAGALIQNAMPHLTAAQREILVSGTCETCFERLFAVCCEDDDEI